MTHTLQLRQKFGLTQVKAARLLGVHPITISKWENGKAVPSWEMEMFLVAFLSSPKKPAEIHRLLNERNLVTCWAKLLEHRST